MRLRELVIGGVLAFGALLAPRAHGEPELGVVETQVKRSRTVKVTVNATFDGPGRIRLEGTVNGRPVLLEKRVRRAGSRKVRFRLRARRFGQRRPTDDVRFDLRAMATDAQGAVSSERAVVTTIPVPLIVLPGLANEVPELHPIEPALAAFARRLNAARGDVYTTDGKRTDLLVHTYPSLEGTLEDHAKELHKAIRKVLRKSPYKQVDIVGYSMGGLVARTWNAGKGEGRVRRMVSLGTPHEGTPLAYVAALVTSGQLDGLLGGQAGAAVLLDLLRSTLGDNTQSTLTTFYPTYPWVNGLFGGGSNPVQDEAPLTSLNARAPDAAATYHAFAYTESPGAAQGLPIGTFETVDALAFAAILGGGLGGGGLEDFDITTLADGEGDLIVPARSAFLRDVPAWAAVVQEHDVGIGTHIDYPSDAAVITRIATILATP